MSAKTHEQIINDAFNALDPEVPLASLWPKVHDFINDYSGLGFLCERMGKCKWRLSPDGHLFWWSISPEMTYNLSCPKNISDCLSMFQCEAISGNLASRVRFSHGDDVDALLREVLSLEESFRYACGHDFNLARVVFWNLNSSRHDEVTARLAMIRDNITGKESET